MATFNVANQSQLNGALRNAKSGDTILLASDATFSRLEIYQQKFNGPVTVASADKSRPATILEMNINGTANLTIDGVKFNHTGRNDKPFFLENSQKVTIKNSAFDGHKDGGGFGTGFGLIAKQSSDVALQNNTVKAFSNGFSFFDMRNIDVRGNTVTEIRNDGMTFAGIKTGKIEGNALHSFRSPASLGHKDSIQFWTANSTASENIMIRNNTFDSNDGRQTIFMGNDHAGRGDGSQPYKDILIENNAIRADHGNGISIDHVNGAVIRGNSLTSSAGPDGQMPMGKVPLINVTKTSANVLIAQNKTASLQKVDGHNFKYDGNSLTTNKQFWHWTDATSVAPMKSGPSATFQAWASGSAVGSASESQTGPDAPAEAAPAVEPPASPVAEPEAPDLARGAAEHFRFSGEMHGSGRKIEFTTLDFTTRDTVTLGEYERGTFQHQEGGNHVRAHWDGTFVKIDSLVDIAELAHASRSVSARVEQDDLVLSVEQGRGVDEFTFRGLGEAFRQVDNPELF